MNVLLVGDDRNVGSYLRRRIEGAGHVLDWTAEKRQAFECASSAGYDAVIVDIGRSAAGGIELCAELRHLSASLPILVLSASDRMADRLESFSAGADDVLAKPFDFDELMARLTAIQRRRMPERVDPGARSTRMIVLDRKGNAPGCTSHVVPLTDREMRFFDVLLGHRTQGVSLAAAFRKACDVDVDLCTDARGMKRGLRLCLASARDAGRRFVLASARLARRRA